MIDGPIERRRITQEIGVLPLEVSHLLDHIDTLRCVEDLVKDAGALQAQIHQREVDVVITAAPGLQRIARALFFLQPRPHLRQLLSGTAALPVAPPVYFLQPVQKFCGSLRIAHHAA